MDINWQWQSEYEGHISGQETAEHVIRLKKAKMPSEGNNKFKWINPLHRISESLRTYKYEVLLKGKWGRGSVEGGLNIVTCIH